MNGHQGYRFVQVPGFRTVMCKICHTHISVDREAVCFNAEEQIGFFGFTVNLENGTRWNIENDTMINMHCYGCKRLMGSKFVHVEEPTATLQAGTVMLCLERLQLLTGEGMLEATTLIPPEPEQESQPASDDSP